MSFISEGLSYLERGLKNYNLREKNVKELFESVQDDKNIRWLNNRLIDEASKDTLDCIVKYRNSGKHQDLFGANTKFICQQYLIPEFMNYAKDGEIYVDCGVYNGETIYEYIQEMKLRGLTPESIIGFEPNNLNEYYANLFLRNILDKSDLDKLEIANQGVSDVTRSARLTMDGSCSKVCEEGGQYVSLVKLDDALSNCKIDCIKMDLEGHEIPALNGAKRHILEYEPRLAICVYHNPNDIWDIPKLICEINPNYRFYLRQHFAGTHADNELVLYGVVPHDD